MQRMKLICSGLVQGVGFRYFVCMTGRALDVTGFVINLENGDVLIEVQGAPDQLKAFIARVQAGNRHSQIDRLSQYPIPAVDRENGFEILYD
jgi:acylphosphatase